MRLNRRHRSTSLGFLRGGELCRAGFSAPAPPLIDLASQFISDSLPIRTIKLGLEGILANLMFFADFDSSSLQMKTGCVALVLCLNITVDPPDVINISPCARIEAWIG
ncbi:hypothetical protein F2Q68_00033056 [Brassica cretica]|uniref:Raptor N-terminal CASPase-like domain-containing protein n=1 Tax=Brassica cretica TaxID=69181 RepID=A0A8S9G3R6_BRACR|nr:hypothetical protein F2Q68_00033056 [Brassica cretica]